MGPLAQKVVRELHKAKRAKVVDLTAWREARQFAAGFEELLQDVEFQQLPPNQGIWMYAFRTLAGLGSSLLGSRTLAKYADRVNAAEEAYEPGGPPISPVLDSVFMTWMMMDLRMGPRGESLCDIIADAGAALRVPVELRDAARILSASRFGVYRVEDQGESRLSLTDLATQETVEAVVPIDLKARSDLWLTRLLPPPPFAPANADWTVWTTPYHFRDPQAVKRWQGFFDRIAESAPNRAERVARHFKNPPHPHYWFDYILDGYAGVTEEGAIVLVGVPDRPETLPHSDEFDPASLTSMNGSPLARVRARLLAIAESWSGDEVDPAEIRSTAGAPAEPLQPEVDEMMQTSYRMYSRRDASGRTPLEVLRAEADALGVEEIEILDALDAGWFSAFEVVQVRVDEGIKVRDALRRRTFWVTERSATRQVDRGDVLAGRVMVRSDRLTLEGAVVLVPDRVAQDFIARMRSLRDELARCFPRWGWKARADVLAAYAVPVFDAVWQQTPRPALVNYSGDEIVFSEAYYEVRDRDRVRYALAKLCADNDGDSFRYVIDGTLIADLELSDKRLVVRCNSQERLAMIRERIEEELGDAVTHRADSHQDPWTESEPDDQPAAERRIEATPEVRELMAKVIKDHMRRWMDEPVPAFDNRTPRQAVRTQKGRDDVAHWLVRQEQIFNGNPQTAGVDLTEIWHALGLERPQASAEPV